MKSLVKPLFLTFHKFATGPGLAASRHLHTKPALSPAKQRKFETKRKQAAIKRLALCCESGYVIEMWLSRTRLFRWPFASIYQYDLIQQTCVLSTGILNFLGFVRITPTSHTVIKSEDYVQSDDVVATGSKRKQTNSSGKSVKKRKLSYQPDALDQTWIHPESYDVTRKYDV